MQGYSLENEVLAEYRLQLPAGHRPVATGHGPKQTWPCSAISVPAYHAVLHAQCCWGSVCSVHAHGSSTSSCCVDLCAGIPETCLDLAVLQPKTEACQHGCVANIIMHVSGSVVVK